LRVHGRRVLIDGLTKEEEQVVIQPPLHG